MKNKAGLILVVLAVISVTSLQNCSKDPSPIEPTPQWSDPVLFYSNPDSYEFIRFSAVVSVGVMNVVSSFSLFHDMYYEYSGIYLLRQEPGKKLEKKKLSQENIPSQHPSILHDRLGNLHFIWGDRRQDPDFIMGCDPRFSYSTDVIYYNFNKGKPVHIYARNTTNCGVYLFPLSLTEDNQGNLHTVFHAERLFPDPDGNLQEFGPNFIVYLNSSTNGQWNSPRFLYLGHTADIVSLPGERLVVVYLGVDPNSQVPSQNDVLTTYSNDGGISWSDPAPVLISGNQAVRSFDLIKDSDDKLHLIIGRGSLFEFRGFWHSVSNDGGISWSEPEMVLNLDQNPIIIFETIIDPYGQIHIVGIDLDLSVWYSSISPKKDFWEDFIKLDFVEPTPWISLTFDNAAKELYLFWTSRDQEKQILHYAKKPVRSP